MERRRILDVIGRALLIAAALRSAFAQDSDTVFERGVSLAQQGLWAEAKSTLLEGAHAYPKESRFAVELGGVAFKQNDPGEAIRWLRRGLRLDPTDPYASDFLGTIYFLQSNTEAALRYWNRAGKPIVADVRLPERLRVDPVLLDSAFRFAPGETLQLNAFRATGDRITGLGILRQHSLRLEAGEDGRVHVVLTGVERNGFGTGRLGAAITTLRGVGYRTLRPEYANIGGSAINVDTLLRWDPNKRRASIVLSGPQHGASRRYTLLADLRDERWSLREGNRDQLGAFRLRRAAIGGAMGSVGDGTWSWQLGGELSDRTYRDVTAWTSQTAILRGRQLKQTSRITRTLWQAPDRRIESRAMLSAETGRIWSGKAHTFEKLQAGAGMQWFPKLQGDDYAVRASIRAGRVFGTAPLDELPMVGLERDSNLWLRGHVGTQDGRKGSAPIGRAYALANVEIDKVIYNAGWWSVALSPFFDAGRIDNSVGLGRRQWLFDVGVQAKLRLLGIPFTVVYGKDLRTGANAFYALDGATGALPARY